MDDKMPTPPVTISIPIDSEQDGREVLARVMGDPTTPPAIAVHRVAAERAARDDAS